LDKFSARTTRLVKLLNKELTVRKKQYEYYRDFLLSEEQLGDEVKIYNLQQLLLNLTDGMHNLPKIISKNTTNHPIISAQNINNGKVTFDTSKYVDEETFQQYNKRTKIESNDVLMTVVGAIGRVAVYKYDIKPLFQRSVCVMKPNVELINPSFLKYILESSKINSCIQNNAHGAAQKGIYMKQVAEIQIPLPPLEVQERVVKILDKFDSLVNDLSIGLPAEIEARNKQYEYYRDKLLSFRKIED
jgi:type I restriction enzyme, S subunit